MVLVWFLIVGVLWLRKTHPAQFGLSGGSANGPHATKRKRPPCKEKRQQFLKRRLRRVGVITKTARLLRNRKKLGWTQRTQSALRATQRARRASRLHALFTQANIPFPRQKRSQPENFQSAGRASPNSVPRRRRALCPLCQRFFYCNPNSQNPLARPHYKMITMETFANFSSQTPSSAPCTHARSSRSPLSLISLSPHTHSHHTHP